MTRGDDDGRDRDQAGRSADRVADELGHRNTAAAAGARAGGSVLALDIATTVGWALLSTAGVVSSGAKSFAEGRGEARGDRLWRWHQWLAGLKGSQDIRLIAYERVGGHGPGGFHAAHCYGQLEGVLLLFCAKHGIRVESIATATLKKSTTGRGNARKPEMIAAVRALGFRTDEHNEADALAVLHWATGARGQQQQPID